MPILGAFDYSANIEIKVGRIGQDPELRFLPTGAKVVNFSIATKRSWKDKDTGEKHEKTTWHPCTVWGDKFCDFVREYFHSGDLVLVLGSTDRNKDDEGKWWAHINVKELTMLASSKKGSMKEGTTYAADENGVPPEVPLEDDNIPF